MTFAGLPFPTLEQELSRLRSDFERLLGGNRLSSAGVFPAVNIYDDGESFLVRAELPGIDKDSLEITTKGEQLTIRGERKLDPAEAPANYHRREREGGQFRRVVSLPQPVDANKVSATYRNGVLDVILPRAAEAQPRKISIG